MLREKELNITRKRFKGYIQSRKISKPKPNRKEFFRGKAESSLGLARDLLEKGQFLDWAINIAYYSMYYNAICLLAWKNVDLDGIDESTHVLTYQALVYYFYIQNPIIEEQYLEDFKLSMDESNTRLRTIARQKSAEIISSFRNAKEERGRITYELGKTAELKSAQTAIRRAERFDILAAKMIFKE